MLGVWDLDLRVFFRRLGFRLQDLDFDSGIRDVVPIINH